MYGEKKILGLIPARGGSKGILNKNIVPIRNKPLLAYTLEESVKSSYIDELIVSSDSDEILNVSMNLGLKRSILRPEELSEDSSRSIDVVNHALDYLKEDNFDYVILLQPTSPLRTSHDIDKAIEKCLSAKATSLISLVANDKSPFWMYEINEDDTITSILNSNNVPHQRQEAKASFAINGAIYILSTHVGKHSSFINPDTLSYVMPKSRSLDIDTIEDLDYFEYLLAKND